MHILFQLHLVLRFVSTVVISVLINISFQKQTNFAKFLKLRVHEYTSGFTLTLMAELFHSCKSTKFTGLKYSQN